MNVLKILITGVLVATAATSQAEEVRHLLVAKFLLQRLEPAELTEAQMTEFNRLSAELRARIDQLRETTGISREVMERRDAAHRELKTLKLPADVYWERLQKDASLNEAQLKAFQKTQDQFDTFKQAAMELLTDEQRAHMKSSKKSS
ncbi:MAG: hypothetical protein AAGA96_03545 [Verrucomicrobiota bacterium]